MKPLVYHYNPETHVYLGCTEAFESPLEPGVFLCPAHATFISPVAEIVAESQVSVWDHTNSFWAQKERSPPSVYTHTYSIPEEPILEEPIIPDPIPEHPIIPDPITEDPVIPDPIPEEPIPEEPIPDVMTQLRWMRDYYLEKVDWVAIKCFTTGMPYPTEWATYVQALRDLPVTSKDLAVNEKGRLLEASVVLPTRPADPKYPN